MKAYTLLSLAFISCFVGCTYVEPGHSGIRVNMYGNSKGVEDSPLVTGRVFYNPMTEVIYEFPTFMQNAVWTKDATEGSPTDESVTFNSIEGASLNVDVGIAYQIQESKIPHIFVKFRKDADALTHGYLRTKVRDGLNKHAAEMKVTDIFGVGKAKLLEIVKNELVAELEHEGFIIDNISFISEFRVDNTVSQSINKTITATNLAIEAENKVRQIEAEARQAEAKAEGEAQARLLKAKADAEANRLLTESLKPELLQYEALQKWDGKLPTYMGNSNNMPFLTVPTGNK